jgi:stage II sporulation protein D
MRAILDEAPSGAFAKIASVTTALFLLAALTITTHAQAEPQDIQIRLRIQRELKVVDLQGERLQISAPGTVTPIESPLTGVTNARITRKKDGKWLVRWKGVQGAPDWIESDALVVRGQMLRVGGEEVPKDLEIHEGKAGFDIVVNLDLETYLAGVIPSEMPASWPMEALKAQAIAARSFALRSRQDRKSQHFDVDSTVMDQVYKFLHEAEENPSIRSRINKVVQETRGQILVDGNERVVKAYYSADCGCQSEDPKFVWGTVEAFQSVKDPSCAKRKPISWDVSLDRHDVRARLLEEFSLPKTTNLKTMQVSGRTPSGRVSEVVASFDVDGKFFQAKLPAQQFRKVFGFEKIRSADFSIKWFADQLLINGTGLGHGVGLCQMGARSLADEGMDYRAILKLYYPKAKLKTRKQA